MKTYGIAFLAFVAGGIFWACKVRVGESEVKAAAGGFWKCDSLGSYSLQSYQASLNSANCSGSAFMVDKGAFCCFVVGK